MNDKIQQAADKILNAIDSAGSTAYANDPNKYVNALIELKKLEILTTLGTNIKDFGKNIEAQLPAVFEAIRAHLSQ